MKLIEPISAFSMNFDPTLRVTTLSATLGQLFMSLSIFGCQQNFVQRYCSMTSERKVIKWVYNFFCQIFLNQIENLIINETAKSILLG